MNSKTVFTMLLLVLLFASVTSELSAQRSREKSKKSKQQEVPTANHPGDVEPGKTALLTSDGEYPMEYFLRVPKSYNDQKGARVIIFMHGSNMSGLTYLRSFEAAGWCEDDILVCPNGETGDDDPYKAHNFTFSSANFVNPITEKITDAFNATRVYIGGHSQGGFLTYSVIMHFPDLYDGAFPMAGDCWMQNEPNLWEDNADKVEKQKKVAIAVIHGQADPVVNYSQGEHAYNVFLISGYPKLRFFNPERLGHQFMLSPVPEALDWLDAMNGANVKQSLKLTKDWGTDKEWGWAHQTALALQGRFDLSEETETAIENINKTLEKNATRELLAMTSAMEEEPADEWLPKWHEFRRQYGATGAARELVENFDKKRLETREKAQELFYGARGDMQKDATKPDGYAKLEQILEEAPCSYHAYYAMKWLENRTDKPEKKKKKKFR